MKTIGILAVMAVGVVLIGYWMIFAGSDDQVRTVAVPAEPVDLEEMVSVEPEERVGVGTLNELQLSAVSLECKIKYEPANQADQVEGTYFVHEGVVRGDFLTGAPDLDGQVLSSMIVTSDTMYVWSEIAGETYGAKQALAAAADSQLTAGEPIKLDQPVDYRCVTWKNVDRTVFVPPSDVLFKDVSEVIQGGMEYGTTYEE